MKIQILFLSQQRLLRETMQQVFNLREEFIFLPPVSSSREAIDSISRFEPEVILADLSPGLFGLRMTDELRRACPSCRILVLTSYPDPIAAKQLSLAGVCGFVSKNIGIEDLFGAIREIHSGKRVFSEGGRCVVHEESLARNGNRALTAREAQVLELVANGLANKQVASELGISIKTVEKHRQRVMSKLNTHETAGLSWRAFCLGVAHDGELGSNGGFSARI